MWLMRLCLEQLHTATVPQSHVSDVTESLGKAAIFQSILLKENNLTGLLAQYSVAVNWEKLRNTLYFTLLRWREALQL